MSPTPNREYCHPIDASIIRVLNNSAVNTIFRTILSISADSYFGPLLASGIPVTERSFPQIHHIVTHCADTLHIPVPYVVVTSSSDFSFNAVTTGSDQKPYIILGSSLVKVMGEDYLKFVIGHECGHIAMGHTLYSSVAETIVNIAKDHPVIGTLVKYTAGYALNAWSRRSEITADRAGLLCCGDLEASQRALVQLEMGFLDASDANMEDYVQSSRQFLRNGIVRRLGEYNLSHPLLPKRIEALELFMHSTLLYRITGQTPAEDTLNDRALEYQVEKLIQVL